MRISTSKGILLVFGLSLALRLFTALSTHRVVDDEAIYVRAGMDYVSSILRGVITGEAFSSNTEHPALAKLIFGVSVGLLRGLSLDWVKCHDACSALATFDQVIKGRIATVLISSFGPVFLFLLVKDIAREKLAALAAGVFLATYPYYVFYSALTYLDTISVTFMIVALWSFYRAQTTSRGSYYLLAGALTGLAFASKYPGILALPTMWLFPVAKWTNREGRACLRRELKWMLLTVVVTVFVFYVADPIIWVNPGSFVWSFLYHGLKFYASPTRPWYLYIGWVFEKTPLVAFVSFLVGFSCVTYEAFRPTHATLQEHGGIIFIFYLALGLAFLSILHQKNDSYFTIAVPPIAGLAGIGLSRLSNYGAQKLSPTFSGLNGSVIALVLLLMHFVTILWVGIVWRLIWL
jgi:4-amino-4-deoxy-L-arabinose transferase-like glycosyltransferase